MNKIVDVEEFVKSDKYLNHGKIVSPFILKIFKESFALGSPYKVIVFEGKEKIGKNYFAYVSMLYMVYCISCLGHPQVDLGIAPELGINFMLCSSSKVLAKNVVLSGITYIVENSNYFKNVFSFDPRVKSELRFPYNIRILPMACKMNSILGVTIYGGGIVDNFNLIPFNDLEDMYAVLCRRLTAKWHIIKNISGKLIYISSKFGDSKFLKSRKAESNIQLEKFGKTDIYIVKG